MTYARIANKAELSATSGSFFAGFSNGAADKLLFRVRLSNGDRPFVISKSRVPLDEWTQVAFTFDGSYIRIYINGELDRSEPANGTLNTDTSMGLGIGAYVTSSTVSRRFKGDIVDVRYYEL